MTIDGGKTYTRPVGLELRAVFRHNGPTSVDVYISCPGGEIGRRATLRG